MRGTVRRASRTRTLAYIDPNASASITASVYHSERAELCIGVALQRRLRETRRIRRGLQLEVGGVGGSETASFRGRGRGQ